MEDTIEDKPGEVLRMKREDFIIKYLLNIKVCDLIHLGDFFPQKLLQSISKSSVFMWVQSNYEFCIMDLVIDSLFKIFSIY